MSRILTGFQHVLHKDLVKALVTIYPQDPPSFLRQLAEDSILCYNTCKSSNTLARE